MPENFSIDWLALREPADIAARSAALARRFAGALPPSPKIADLAAGSGANRRYLQRFLAGARWVAIDSDAALLATNAGVECRRLDLAHDIAGLDLAGIDGLTAAAFFDLVSAEWLETFADRVARSGRPLLAGLTVDGRFAWTPTHPDDGAVAAAFARDQARDKGFGPALGGSAAVALGSVLAARGYAVTRVRSDWVIDAVSAGMLAALVDLMATVAGPGAASWQAARQAALAQGALALRLGHEDLLALPPA